MIFVEMETFMCGVTCVCLCAGVCVCNQQLEFTCSFLSVLADTPPPAYMPPDEQLGQESQSMDTTSSLVPPNIARGGEYI